MGVVYRAQDTKLLREVALKFLPPGADGDRMAIGRLTREARTASALNHPNICTIYEIGEHDGRPFIAMELVEGQSLSQAIDGTPTDITRLLSLGIEIADALDAAHGRGILHRDIKPSNIIVTARGHAKILDFGLAKAIGSDRGHALSPDAPTQMMTSPGIVAGTVGYMSPEQARGQDLDARSDLFSFGAVLYEMATGRPTFGGSTIGVVIDALLNHPPTPPRELNASLPPALDDLLSKALEKDRDLRYQTAADLRADLQRLSRGLSGGAVVTTGRSTIPVVASSTRPMGRRVAVAAATIVAVAATAYAVFDRQTPLTVEPSHTTLAEAMPVTEIPALERSPAPVAGGDVALTADTSVVATPPPTDLPAIRAKLRSGDAEGALADLRDVMTRQPAPPSIEAYALLLEVHQRRADPTAAIAAIEELTTQHSTNPRAADLLLQIARMQVVRQGPGQAGRLMFARQLTDRIRTQYPDSAAAPAAIRLQEQLDARLGAPRGAVESTVTPTRRAGWPREGRGSLAR